jgi:signal transduction histidine kinase
VGITYAPLIGEDGKLINIIVNVRDITHFRKAQEMTSTFTSIISHELKTPVALIKGYASTMLREDAQWDEETVRESFAVIEDEADRLTGLINNLLETTRLQALSSFKLEWDPVDLAQLAERSAADFSTQTDRHTITVDFPDDFPLIMGDATRLRQVIDNLLSNAIKYSPNGGEIRLNGTFTKSSVRVKITDEGIGIPQDEQQRIFERFYRVDDALTRRTTGTGLGLYLTKAIIEAHHGEIEVESTPGQGTTFTFQLPRYRKEKQENDFTWQEI